MADRLTPFGKYLLLERINVGGMAEVFKAKTVGVEGFEKIVAIKRILPSVAEDEEFIRMFVDEAKITSQLSHANLAQTFDLGKIDDTYYIAMEYVPGKDLRAVFERVKRLGDRVPLPLAAWVVSRVCEGLDYAHRKRDAGGRELQIVHRDVSPQNIVLSYEGEVKLIDFGIAKAANKITRTQAGILKGKFGYMSPEQVRGLPLDRRSDIFAAGVVLYELCTGERLFTGASDFSVLEKVQQARVAPPSSIAASVPPALERIILKALARERDERYQHAGDLAADLAGFLLESQARPVTRDDLAAFMKKTFPDDERREAPARRPPPRIDERVRKPPPRIEEVLSGRGLELDPERTLVGAGGASEGRAEIIVRSKLPPSAQVAEPTDGPTRPMSMTALAEAERQLAQRQKLAAAPVVLDEDTPTPRSPPAPEALAGPDERPAASPRIEDQETQVRPAPPPPPAGEKRPLHVPRTQTVRWIQAGIIAVALAVAAWALLSTPRPPRQRTFAREQAPAAPAVLAGGANPAPPALTVLSSPPNALVYVDGEKKGTTPAVLPALDPDVAHAITVEKRCYRSWQVALPPGAGPRQLAATLQVAPGACPGSHLEATGMAVPPALPGGASGALGFLNLGSRPGAQVVIDGVDIGQTTPLLAWPLRSGTHRVRLVGHGAAKELSVEIRGGETHSEIVDLPAAPTSRRGRR